jgi:hypothetical protein
MEDDMTDKSMMRRSRSHNRRPADLLAASTRRNIIELDETDLKKVGGGASNATPALLFHPANGRHIKEGLVT